jgi:hypothetical protein
MKWWFVAMGCIVLSFSSAQTFRKLSRAEACRDIDSLCQWYVDQSAAGCDHSKGEVFRHACGEKKSSLTDSISMHQFAFDLAELMAGCNDAHFSLDWMYFNRKFSRGNGFFPYRYIPTKATKQIQIVITDPSENSEIHGAEWIELNGVEVAELIQWAGKFVSVEEGAEGMRDYLAACWLPWLLAPSGYLQRENEWGLRITDGGEILRSKWLSVNENQLEHGQRKSSSVRRSSEIAYSFHAEKAILRIPTFAPKNTLQSQRRINRFFRLTKRRGVDSILIDLRDNGGGNSAFVEYLYGFLDTAGVSAPMAIIQRSSAWATMRLHPWLRSGKLRRRYGHDEDSMAALRVLELKDGTCDTVDLKDRILQKERRVYNGKCFVAINGQTASAAAHFAVLLQRNGRGEIWGQPCNANSSESGGNAMRATLKESGIRIFIPLIRYVNFEVNNSVRKPVLPDHEIWPSLHDISKKIDTITNQFLYHE